MKKCVTCRHANWSSDATYEVNKGRTPLGICAPRVEVVKTSGSCPKWETVPKLTLDMSGDFGLCAQLRDTDITIDKEFSGSDFCIKVQGVNDPTYEEFTEALNVTDALLVALDKAHEVQND